MQVTEILYMHVPLFSSIFMCVCWHVLNHVFLCSPKISARGKSNQKRKHFLCVSYITNVEDETANFRLIVTIVSL